MILYDGGEGVPRDLQNHGAYWHTDIVHDNCFTIAVSTYYSMYYWRQCHIQLLLSYSCLFIFNLHLIYLFLQILYRGGGGVLGVFPCNVLVSFLFPVHCSHSKLFHVHCSGSIPRSPFSVIIIPCSPFSDSSYSSFSSFAVINKIGLCASDKHE